MERGWTKAWRKETESAIWSMPPLYQRVFLWLRLNVNRVERAVPMRNGETMTIKPGQRYTSYQQIAEGVGWTEYGKAVVPNVKTIKDILDWMIKQDMITRESNTHGTLITIVNWTTYNYDSSEEVKPPAPPVKPAGSKPDANLSLFDEFWQVYPKKKSKGDAEKAWKALNPDALLSARMVQAIEKQKLTEDWQKQDGKYIPYPASWLRAKGWEDEVDEATKKKGYGMDSPFFGGR